MLNYKYTKNIFYKFSYYFLLILSTYLILYDKYRLLYILNTIISSYSDPEINESFKSNELWSNIIITRFKEMC